MKIRKKVLFFFTAVLAVWFFVTPAIPEGKASSKVNTATPAFPGAEGWGALTQGGRGGKVYHVTSLADDGKIGTLRHAIKQDGKRVVVFDVCGYIELKENLVIKNGEITIAGQTAPGQGIALKNFPLIIKETRQVIVRYIRVRPGVDTASDMDAVSIKASDHIILDHVSATWGNDEAVSVTDNSTDVTIQWCIIGATIRDHSKGSILTSDFSPKNQDGGLTVHHNFYTSCDDRMPKFGTGHDWGEDKISFIEFENNIVFNWGQKNSGRNGNNQKVQVNYINNWLLYGEDTKDSIQDYAFTDTTDDLKLFIDGNYMNGQCPKNQKDLIEKGNQFNHQDNPFPGPEIEVSLQSAQDARNDIIHSVGASCPARDEIDTDMINDLKNNYPKGIHKINKGIPRDHNDIKYKALDCPGNYKPPADSDNDGMPDDWETANGSDPNQYDGNQVSTNGYTLLENYLNSFCSLSGGKY